MVVVSTASAKMQFADYDTALLVDIVAGYHMSMLEGQGGGFGRASWLVMFVLAALAGLHSGCRKTSSPAAKGQDAAESHPIQLSLLVLDDHELAEAIRRQWSERGEGELLVRELTVSDFVKSPSSAFQTDTVIYPTSMLGTLAESNLIAPLPAKTLRDPNLAWSDVFDQVRLREVSWDRKVYAVPLGCPQLVLFYRADLWAQLQLQPPTTWEEYSSALAKLRSATAEDPSSGISVFSAEPLTPAWASHMLMARAAAYARHRNFLSELFELDTMKPLIDGPPFVRALEELVSSVGTADALRWGPQDTLTQLLDGRAAAAIGWPIPATERSSQSSEGSKEGGHENIEVITLPGATESFDRLRAVWDSRAVEDAHVPLVMGAGRVASISSRTPNAQAAANLLVWIGGKEWSAQLAPASRHVTMYRFTHTSQPQRWMDASFNERLAAQYAQVITQSLTRGESLTAVRIPGRDEYLAALDEAIARAVRGEQAAGEALKQAAAAWDSITERLGRDQQKQAYRRSLGL